MVGTLRKVRSVVKLRELVQVAEISRDCEVIYQWLATLMHESFLSQIDHIEVQINPNWDGTRLHLSVEEALVFNAADEVSAAIDWSNFCSLHLYSLDDLEESIYIDLGMEGSSSTSATTPQTLGFKLSNRDAFPTVYHLPDED